MLIKFSFIAVIFCSLNSLCSCKENEKFDKRIWSQYNSVDGPDRDLMAEDLIETHKLLGLDKKQMLDLLGDPANYTDTTKAYYELSEKYDSIDPVSGKNLILTFNADSIIVTAKIEEWHKH
jgi:hypothetical protein